MIALAQTACKSIGRLCVIFGQQSGRTKRSRARCPGRPGNPNHTPPGYPAGARESESARMKNHRGNRPGGASRGNGFIV